MREILFRGKSISSGDWVYGLYVEATMQWINGRKPHKSWIFKGFIANGGWIVPTGHKAVADDTVSQYTGIKDKYGHKIFEGDILKVVSRGRKSIVHVKYGGTSFYVPEFATDLDSVIFDHAVEIIGNIYDNLDLIETGKEREEK